MLARVCHLLKQRQSSPFTRISVSTSSLTSKFNKPKFQLCYRQNHQKNYHDNEKLNGANQIFETIGNKNLLSGIIIGGITSAFLLSSIPIVSASEDKNKREDIGYVTLGSKNTQLPIELDYPQGKVHLISTDVKKVIIFFEAYVIGMYLESNQAKKLLEEWKKTDGNPKFLSDNVLKDGTIKFFRLVPSSDSNESHIQKSLIGNSQLHLTSRFGEENRDKATEVSMLFKQLIPPGIYKAGTTIDLCCDKDGNMTSYVSGRDPVTIQSKDLVWALTSIYLGEVSKAPRLKSGLSERLEEFVNYHK